MKTKKEIIGHFNRKLKLAYNKLMKLRELYSSYENKADLKKIYKEMASYHIACDKMIREL